MESLTKSAVKWRTNKQKGMCCACGKCPPLPGRTLCADCKENLTYSQAAYRLRNREAIADRGAKRYWQLVDAGLCATCGKNPSKEGGRRCFECAVKASEATLRSRNRRKERESGKGRLDA